MQLWADLDAIEPPFLCWLQFPEVEMIAVLPMASLAEGEMAPVRLDGVDMLICHVEGQFYAVASRCSHAGQPLVGGRLDGYQLRCPLHRASFDIRTGAALGPPASEPIDTYPVLLEAGKVHVSILR